MEKGLAVIQDMQLLLVIVSLGAGGGGKNFTSKIYLWALMLECFQRAFAHWVEFFKEAQAQRGLRKQPCVPACLGLFLNKCFYHCCHHLPSDVSFCDLPMNSIPVTLQGASGLRHQPGTAETFGFVDWAAVGFQLLQRADGPGWTSSLQLLLLPTSYRIL